MLRPPQLLALALAFTLLACAAEDTSRWTGATVRDSAGVTIVENAGVYPVRDADWSVSATPLARVDGDPGDGGGLYRFLGAIRLPSGTLVVNQAGGTELLFLRADGSRVRTLEASGSGPGEFRRLGLWSVVPAPDGGVAALDIELGKVLVLDSVGHFVRELSLERGPGQPRLHGVLPDGSFVVTYSGASELRDGVSRRAIDVARHAADGTLAGVLETFQGRGSYSVLLDGRRLNPPVPLEAEPTIGVAGDAIHVNDGRSGEIRVYTAHGTLSRIVRRTNPARAVTDADIDTYTEDLVGVQGSPADRVAVRMMLASAPRPTEQPAFYQMVVDGDGYLFTTEPGCPDRLVCWNVYDPEGSFISALDVPQGTGILQVGSDYLLGLTFPEVSVPVLTIHALQRR
ncbi:MAG: hypothetical protein WEB88_17930 [Gemmatimonadota bacterium]